VVEEEGAETVISFSGRLLLKGTVKRTGKSTDGKEISAGRTNISISCWRREGLPGNGKISHNRTLNTDHQ